MTGVTVVTTRDASGTPVGFTANSFSSVSLDPPLLSVCPSRTLSSFDTFATCDRFAVSILAEGQEDVSTTFASFKGDRFATTRWTPDAHGIPLIGGAIAHFSCRTHTRVEAGDHLLLLGEVDSFTHDDRPGLGYLSGRYFSLGLEQAARDPGRINICGAIVEHGAHVLLEPTPTGYRLPHVQLTERRGLRASLSAALAARGLHAHLGQVYSVYNDARTNTHFAWLLGSCTGPVPAGLEAVPTTTLAAQKYTDLSTATMLARFATEAASRDFTLYLGDTETGDIHERP
ncbi:MAG: flavin reductase family protein [Pseudooceanicola sp.]|nr:flavin reductase family protein [Pseudooceanicola sp.]